MFSYQNSHGFDDFYNSLQTIQDSSEPNECFGKKVHQHHHRPSFARTSKKIVSVESFHGLQAYDNGIKKSFSTNAFEENDVDANIYGKPRMSYVYEEQSTTSSISPYNSMGSFSSSAVSLAATQNHKKSKLNPKRKVKNNAETDFRVKYKTEVCKYWAEYGVCEFGDQCAFAHGKDEIRQKVHISSNYKTKKCVQFHENGFCPYGSRCQFIHCALKENSQNPIFGDSYANDLENPDVWCGEDPDCVCMRRKNRPRLPCLVKVSNDHLCNYSELDG